MSNPGIRATISKDEKLEELKLTIYYEDNEKCKIVSILENISSVNEAFSYKPSNLLTNFNLVLGIVLECFEKIVQHNDLYYAKENMQIY